MKKLLLTIFVAMFFATLYAPGGRAVLTIIEAEKIHVFDKMLWSFMKVESNFDTDTVNRLGYGGVLQIGQSMIDEANRICELTSNPRRFVLDDRLDSLKSVQIWYIVQAHWNPSYELKRACKVWNPEASVNYYKKIKSCL